MSHVPNRNEDIIASSTRRGLPRAVEYGQSSTAEYVQALDNFTKVFGIRQGDHVVMLTDPLLDPRVLQAVRGLAISRGATFISYMGTSTRYLEVPAEARELLSKATFVVSTWFASVFDPFCIALRRKQGQRWVKITFFRNIDLWHTPQARFPVDLVGELIRATHRLYPENGPFEMRITDPRGTDFRIPFSAAMRDQMKRDNRWRGRNCADEDGCYVHYMPTHGPNIFEPTMYGNDPDYKVGLSGVIRPQWAVGWDMPFEEPPEVEFQDDKVVAVHGNSDAAHILRDFIVGGTLEELGCGHNPKAPRFDIYPAGPNSPGALHFGINGLTESKYLRRMMPNWEEPHVHMDLVTFDATVVAGNNTLIEDGYLMSLCDPEVVAAARKYGDPTELLESFPV
jgi:hypothetical protein